MQKKCISGLLVFILTLGLITPFGEAVYAASKFAFTWEQSRKISDIIEISNRTEADDELFLKWSYGTGVGGSDTYKGDYLLTYNLTDRERIEITINNESDKVAKIKYRIKKLDANGNIIGEREAPIKAYDENGSKLYWLYNSSSNGWFNETTGEKWKNSATNTSDGTNVIDSSIFAPTGIEIEMKRNETDGIGPDISIEKGSTAAFKYDNKLIVMKFDDAGQNILFGIDSIERSKIYRFNISTGNQSEYMDIFKLAEFEITPVGPLIIDKTQTPSAFPGEKPVSLQARIALPSIWDNTVSQYVYNEYLEGEYKGIEAVINLKSSKNGESIQINVPNMYSINDIPNISKTSSTKATIDTESIKIESAPNGKKYYTFKLNDLESSRLYTTANITMGAKPNGTPTKETKLKTIVCNLAKGDNAYTYIEYDSETQGSGARVLKIKPYNVNGSYYIYKKSLDSSIKQPDNLIARYDYTGQEIIEIPVSNEGNDYYLVEFVYELGTIDSQKLRDDPDKTPYLVTPQIEVKDYKIITENITVDGVPTQNKKLNLQLSWSGGNQTTFDSLVHGDNKVVYTFSKTPFSPRESKYADFLMLQVGSDYQLVKKANAEGDNWETAKILKSSYFRKVNTLADGTETFELIFTVDLEFELFSEDSLENRDEPSKIFYYPSVYYLKMNGGYKNILGIDKVTADCNPVNITLDKNAYIVLPPPQNIAVNNIKSQSFRMNWATVAENVYGDYIKANDYTLQEKNGAGVNIFLTQQNVLNEADTQKQLEYFDKDNENLVTIDFKDVLSSTTAEVITLDFSQPTAMINGRPLMDYLRNNKMIKIINVPQLEGLNIQVVQIDGIDKNTIYYTALQTVLNVISNVDGTEKQVFSDTISQILTFTTKKDDDLEPPKPSEISPEAPTDFRKDTEVEQLPTIITLTWTDVKDPESIDDIKVKKEYEIIRVDKRLDDTLLSKRNSFDSFWANDLKVGEKVGWQTLSSQTQPKNLLIYNNTDFVLDETKTDGKYIYNNTKVPKLQFVDKTPMPNRLYYYYIRTVRMAESTDGVYTEAAWSSWQPVSVTTSPVQSPTDLKIDRTKKYFDYEPKSEIVINFFAPIPAGTTMAQIAALYPLEYSIMMDGGEWKTVNMDVTNSSLFKTGDEKKEGYQQFVYKITGLDASKGYTIRVRMNSRINPITDPIPLYDVSLYSNSVSFRTDMDQEEYDDEENLKKWLKLFDDEVLALSTKAYWLFTNSSNSYEAIYRTKTFDGELQKATSGAYQFETNNQSKQTYYIPAGAINLSDSSNIGFRAVKDDMEVLIRPSSFDSSVSEAVMTVVNKIKEGDSKDYYIKISLDWNKTNESINNTNPLTETVQIRISVVGSRETEKTLDAKFVDLFNKATANSETVEARIRNRLKEDLKAEIKAGADDKELYKLVMDAVGDVYKDLIGDIEDEFDSNTRSEHSIDSLGENMLITATVNSQSTVAAYRKNNTTWETITTRDYGGKKGFETKLIGIFVFAGKILNIPDISGVTNSNDVKELIAKYGLDDYFGKDIIDTNKIVTKYMVAGSIARMAGASQGQNELEFLKSKGINITSGKLYNPIANQEALYLLMSLYEIKTGTKISTVRITNYNIIPDISNADESYKKSLQVAAQLGIWTDASIGVKDTITVKNLLEYLGNLSKKINK